ncbi:glycosyltransferase [Olivibacter sp. XZL3]|uniref:glycosyltransferase n=1 Tax=Olivibacter sp. XZL3 TaxID=1735116 RepID=UPI0010661B8A|nr:glycosyltransferase [Olivibacter sp. XZL3]
MKIIFNPPDNKENQYIRLMTAPLAASGIEICALDDFFSSYKHFKSIRLVHLNWFENVDDRSFFVAFRSFFRKMVVLLAIKLGRKPLIWTMHNRSSHEKGLSFFSRTLTDLLIKWSDRIIIHSSASIDILRAQHPKVLSKLSYLPHPNFIGVYGPVIPSSTNSETLKLLFMGVIKPYKNIELLIKLATEFEREITLTIAGKPATEKYKEILARIANGAKNIDLQLRFIDDAEIPSLFGTADLLVLPYDLQSSLNSGTVILAFSYKKTVICPRIGTLSDLKEDADHVLTYSYSSPAEHEQMLRKKIAEAIRLKKEQPNIFTEKGERLFDYIQREHNNKQIGQQLIGLYQPFLSKRKQ